MLYKKKDSITPQYTFADTQKEQEAQLAENPMLKRFADSRETKKCDRYRPMYHFVSPENNLNDPNGICFWKGKWHMFYQGFPEEYSEPSERTRVHWGHAVSDDLIHWKDLPYAIYPDVEESCYSGATLVEDDRVIAIYHGTMAGNMVAISDDDLLLNWKKQTGNAVIPISNPDGSALPYNVFDPCIWKANGYYYSLSAGTLKHPSSKRRMRADFLLRSKDMKRWEYRHPFVECDNFTLLGDDGACPYFLPIGDKHMLLFFSHMSGGQALMGEYDAAREKFVASSHHKFNFGASLPAGMHAPSATPDGEGGIISIFNMNPGYDTKGWNQIMSMPRHLKLNDEGTLTINPAGDYKSLRYDNKHIENVELPANKEVVIEGVRGRSMEIEAEIESCDSPCIKVSVLRSENKDEHTEISIYRERGFRDWRVYDGWENERRKQAKDTIIVLDTSSSSILPDALSRPPECAPVQLPHNEPIKLNIFIDHSSVEVFVNNLQSLGVRVYPGLEDSLGVSITSRGTDAKLKCLDAWQMMSIYE